MRWLWSLENSGSKIKKIAQVMQIITCVVACICAGFGIPLAIINITQNAYDIGEAMSLIFMSVIGILGGALLMVIISLIPNLFMHSFGTISENTEAILEYMVERDFTQHENKK